MLWGVMTSSYKGSLKKLFMQVALGRLEIQKYSSTHIPAPRPRNQQLFLFIYDKRNLGYTLHTLLTAHEHLYMNRKPVNTLLNLG